jgi:iron complex transport system substrate-binding protein
MKAVSGRWILVVCMAALCSGGAAALRVPGCYASGAPETRSVIDITGRTVTVPRKIGRIVTIGPVPVINSYVLALGEGRKIVNGLPHSLRSKRGSVQNAIAPYLAGRPVLQGQMGNQANVEVLIRLRPDIAITMDTYRIKAVEDLGIPVICLQWRDGSDIRENMRVLGLALDRTSRSDEYLRYFDNTLAGVRQVLKGIPRTSMPKVLYFSPNTLTTPHLVTDWWIREAGGQSVTAEIARSELARGGSVSYSHEQVLLWNPDILIVASPEQMARTYKDTRFSMVNAVRNKRVYVIPSGAHSWGQRTIEQPLTVLWAAKTFHPEKFGNLDLVAETQDFYRKFFSYDLKRKEALDMISGASSR